MPNSRLGELERERDLKVTVKGMSARLAVEVC